MFERFTDQARRVVVLAQEEARLLGHGYIGTEHLLLGLIHEGEGIGSQALDRLGITLKSVREQVEEIIGRGASVPSAAFPFSPRVKKVLELSRREALQLNHNYIGPEHILLGLAREGEGIAAQIWVRLGVATVQIRPLVLQLLSSKPHPEPKPDPELNEAEKIIRQRFVGSSMKAEEATIRTIAFQGTDAEAVEVVGWLRQKFGRSHLGYQIAESLLEQINPPE
jgi:ATP-dependent Clp protease ATP-binding subunit ClpC